MQLRTERQRRRGVENRDAKVDQLVRVLVWYQGPRLRGPVQESAERPRRNDRVNSLLRRKAVQWRSARPQTTSDQRVPLSWFGYPGDGKDGGEGGRKLEFCRTANDARGYTLTDAVDKRGAPGKFGFKLARLFPSKDVAFKAIRDQERKILEAKAKKESGKKKTKAPATDNKLNNKKAEGEPAKVDTSQAPSAPAPPVLLAKSDAIESQATGEDASSPNPAAPAPGANVDTTPLVTEART